MEEIPRYILAGWLLDGSGAGPEKRMLLTIAAGKIMEIRPVSDSERIGTERLTDLSYGVILPPFVDSHVHLCMSGSVDPRIREEQLTADCSGLRPFATMHLGHHFSHGVLAIRDGGDRLGCVARFLDEGSLPDEVPVIVKTSGTAFHRAGRYGGLIGRPVGPQQSLAAVYGAVDFHHDQVKVVNSGLNSLVKFGVRTQPQFGLDELRELVRSAHARNRNVMVHANGEEPVRVAIEAGCDSIEHGFFMGEDNLRRMADRGVWWVPTLCTMKGFGDHMEACRIPADKAVVARTLAHQIEQAARARELGVRVALGTDAGSLGVLHGEAVVEELNLLKQAGYSVAEAVRCATEHGARLLGVDDELGRLAVGKPAHFLVARGTPAQLPRKLAHLEAIFRHGRPDRAYEKLRQGIAFRR